jgi:hypothetical protein
MEVALIFLGIISIVIGVICIRIGITYNRMLDGIADYLKDLPEWEEDKE